MDIPNLINNWPDRTVDQNAALAWWDNMAAPFSKRPEPTFDSNPFLRFLEQNELFDGSASVLDIGCGAGGHALALAGRVRQVTGLDLSANMIALARQRAADLAVDNVQFQVADWLSFDVTVNAFAQRFDLVYAHMTPAIQGYASFRKLAECSRHWCVLVKPMIRTESVYDALCEKLEIYHKTDLAGSDVLKAFAILFSDGRRPQIRYDRKCNVSQNPLNEACTIYTNRLKSTHALTAGQEEMVCSFLESVAVNGWISNEMDTQTATLFWHV